MLPTAFAILGLISCGGNEEPENSEMINSEEIMNENEIIEIEESTALVEEGLNELELETQNVNSEIDSLLNGI